MTVMDWVRWFLCMDRNKRVERWLWRTGNMGLVDQALVIFLVWLLVVSAVLHYIKEAGL